MKSTFRAILLSMCLLSTPSMAINIVFDYSIDAITTNWFSTTDGMAAQDILDNDVAPLVSNLLLDTFDALTASQLTGLSPGNVTICSICTAPISGTGIDLTTAADELRIFVGAGDIIDPPMGGTTLGIGGPTWLTGTSSIAGRGEAGHLTTDFAPWYGTLAFDTLVDWYFDDDVSTDDVPGGMNPLNDFFSVALHEVGHILGLGASPTWDAMVASNIFNGINTGMVALESDDGHFLEGTMSTVNGVAQETLLDPTLTLGTRKVFTDLDLAALRDIGWEVNAAVIPIPAAIWLLTGGLTGLFLTSRRTANSSAYK